jgi:Sjoegren syndrome nuclear autoantigen 1
MATEMNRDLQETLEKLKRKRDRLGKQIKANEIIKTKLIRKIEHCGDHHSRVNDRLAKRQAAATEYRKTIRETESAYQKIVDSSATLLAVLQQNAGDSDVEPDSDDEPWKVADEKKPFASASDVLAEQRNDLDNNGQTVKRSAWDQGIIEERPGVNNTIIDPAQLKELHSWEPAQGNVTDVYRPVLEDGQTEKVAGKRKTQLNANKGEF